MEGGYGELVGQEGERRQERAAAEQVWQQSGFLDDKGACVKNRPWGQQKGSIKDSVIK